MRIVGPGRHSTTPRQAATFEADALACLDGLYRTVAVSRSPGDRTLAYVKRANLTPLISGGDPAFNDAVWQLLLARKAPAAAVDCSATEERLQGVKDKAAVFAMDVAND